MSRRTRQRGKTYPGKLPFNIGWSTATLGRWRISTLNCTICKASEKLENTTYREFLDRRRAFAEEHRHVSG